MPPQQTTKRGLLGSHSQSRTAAASSSTDTTHPSCASQTQQTVGMLSFLVMMYLLSTLQAM